MSSGYILGWVNLLACMSHIPGLQGRCILSWVVSKVMRHHHDSLFVTLSGRANFRTLLIFPRRLLYCFSSPTGVLFGVWCFPSRRYAVWPVLSFVFMCANLVLICVLTGRLLFAKIIELTVPCYAVNQKQSRINATFMCVSSMFWWYEWCWNIFSAHWLYYNARSSRFIPCSLCFVCMFVVFSGLSKS